MTITLSRTVVETMTLQEFTEKEFNENVKLSFMLYSGNEKMFYRNRAKKKDLGFISTYDYPVSHEAPMNGKELLNSIEYLSGLSVQDIFKTVNRTYDPISYELPRNLLTLEDGRFVVILKSKEFRNPSNRQYGSCEFRNNHIIPELGINIEDMCNNIL